MIPGLDIRSGDKRCSHMSARVQGDAGFDFLVKNDGKLVGCPPGLWLIQGITLPVAGFHIMSAMLAQGPSGPSLA